MSSYILFYDLLNIPVIAVEFYTFPDKFRVVAGIVFIKPTESGIHAIFDECHGRSVFMTALIDDHHVIPCMNIGREGFRYPRIITFGAFLSGTGTVALPDRMMETGSVALIKPA